MTNVERRIATTFEQKNFSTLNLSDIYNTTETEIQSKPENLNLTEKTDKNWIQCDDDVTGSVKIDVKAIKNKNDVEVVENIEQDVEMIENDFKIAENKVEMIEKDVENIKNDVIIIEKDVEMIDSDEINSIENLMFQHLDDEVDETEVDEFDGMKFIEDLVDVGIRMQSPEQFVSALFTNLDGNLISNSSESNFDENLIANSSDLSCGENLISIEDGGTNFNQKNFVETNLNSQNVENWSLEEIQTNLSNLLQNIPEFFNSHDLRTF